MEVPMNVVVALATSSLTMEMAESRADRGPWHIQPSIHGAVDRVARAPGHRDGGRRGIDLYERRYARAPTRGQFRAVEVQAQRLVAFDMCVEPR
jgi:hypothetical protein